MSFNIVFSIRVLPEIFPQDALTTQPIANSICAVHLCKIHFIVMSGKETRKEQYH